MVEKDKLVQIHVLEMKEICIAEALLANLENSSELQKTISSNFIWLFKSQTQS